MFVIYVSSSIIRSRYHKLKDCDKLKDHIFRDDGGSIIAPFTDIEVCRANIEDIRSFLHHLPTRHGSTGELKREVSEFYSEVEKHFDHEQRDGLFDRKSCHFETHMYFYLHLKDAEFTDPPISIHTSVVIARNEDAGCSHVEKSVKYCVGYKDIHVQEESCDSSHKND